LVVDRSANAIRLTGRCGAPVLLGDVFQPLLEIGCWQTVLLIDGKIGLGVDPPRLLLCDRVRRRGDWYPRQRGSAGIR
jgi:hypothetical protein